MYYKVQLYRINNLDKFSLAMERMSHDRIEELGEVIVKKNRVLNTAKEIITKCPIRIVRSKENLQTKQKYELVILSKDLVESNLVNVDDIEKYYQDKNHNIILNLDNEENRNRGKL